MNNPRCNLPLVLLGAGGHAKVVLSLAKVAGYTTIYVCAPELEGSSGTVWCGIKVVKEHDIGVRFAAGDFGLINGVGMLPGQNIRRDIFLHYQSQGFEFPTLVHPAAWVDDTVKLGAGVQIMAGAVVQADTLVGDNCIINTNSSVDHECQIGSHCHIAPGVTVCGDVKLGSNVFIGCGASIVPSTAVGDYGIVKAGELVKKSF